MSRKPTTYTPSSPADTFADPVGDDETIAGSDTLDDLAKAPYDPTPQTDGDENTPPFPNQNYAGSRALEKGRVVPGSVVGGHTVAEPGDVPAGYWRDPRDGRLIGPRDTLTFGEWLVVDPSIGEHEEAFGLVYGTGADQKMDRGTLDLRISGLPEEVPDVLRGPPGTKEEFERQRVERERQQAERGRQPAPGVNRNKAEPDATARDPAYKPPAE